jgi:hypothetical protein
LNKFPPIFRLFPAWLPANFPILVRNCAHLTSIVRNSI